MVKFNELNQPKIKKTGNSKLYKNFLKILMSAGLLTTSLAGCAPTDKPTDPIIVDPTDPVDEKTEIQILAEEYEFLAWYLDDAKTKIVDGASYDLVALKQQYGDLYRFVEPLSKEEVEYRFKYLVEYFAEQAEKGASEDYAGGLDDVSDNSFGMFAVQINSYYEKMGTTNDKELIPYKEYYTYSERLGRYTKILGVDFGQLLSYSDTKTIIEKSSFEDKKWYVMQYMTEVDMLLNILKINDEKPTFVITLDQKSK